MGKVVILSAPSGAGKSTIGKHLLDQDLGLEFSISACSREPRQGEKDGIDYYFLSEKNFREKIKNDEFIEWEEVYPGNFYGTLKKELDRIWNKGKNVLFDVDIAGGTSLKQKFQDQALSIFIKPPSMKELERRLRNRSSDSEESIQKRLTKAKEEIARANEFDIIIINDFLDKALQETTGIVQDFLNK
ncbi:MAG: guanylate kinase [bacterium]